MSMKTSCYSSCDKELYSLSSQLLSIFKGFHSLGLNSVIMIFEHNFWRLVDGKDRPIESFLPTRVGRM